MDWIEQGLTSPPTQYRLSGRQFYSPKEECEDSNVTILPTVYYVAKLDRRNDSQREYHCILMLMSAYEAYDHNQ